MTALDRIARAAGAHHLAVLGTVSGGDRPPGVATLVLLGPREPGFWTAFTAAPEYGDGAPDPLDRWSSRVIGDLAQALDATAYFPFGGPPYQPFIAWAQASGRAHVSPVGLLVHDTAGLMVSYRGALGFADSIDAPPRRPIPATAAPPAPA